MKSNRRSGVVLAFNQRIVARLASGRKRSRRHQRLLTFRPWLEVLEDRTLLSVSISGVVLLNPLTGLGVPGATVFLDAPGSPVPGQLVQQQQFTFAAGSPLQHEPPVSVTDQLSAPIKVSGLANNFTDFTVSLDVQDTQAGAQVQVALAGPGITPDQLGALLADNADMTLPGLVVLNNVNGNDAQFQGTLDDNAATAAPVVSDTTPPVLGTYRPDALGFDMAETPFNQPSSGVYKGTTNPNGDWKLVFLPLNGNFDPKALTLKSWSIQFQASELSTQTDSSGHYAFSDLVPGDYQVAVQNPTQGQNSSLPNPVQVQDGQSLTNVNIVAPPADRFDPDNTPATAADLGPIFARQSFPDLAVYSGSQDFYQVTPTSTGLMMVTLSASAPLTLQIDGTVVPGTTLHDPSGHVTGTLFSVPVTAGNAVMVEVSNSTGGTVLYSLTAEQSSVNLGTQVTGTDTNSVATDNPVVYTLTAAVAGSVEIDLSASMNGSSQNGPMLQVLNAQGTTRLATLLPATASGQSGTTSVMVPVTAGQQILIVVAANAAASPVDFTLAFNNFDQFETASLVKTPPPVSLYYPVPGRQPDALAVGDLTGSGLPDLVAANTDLTDPISVLMNNGAASPGLFEAAHTYNAGTGSSNLPGGDVRSLLLADFNQDGALDIALSNFASADVSVLLNLQQANGTLSSDHRSNALSDPGQIVAGDLGNGKQDLVVFPAKTAAGQAPKVAVLLGLGDGTFATPVFLQTDLPNGLTYGTVGHFTGPHSHDIAVFSGSRFDLFVGNGDGTFATTPIDGPVLPGTVNSVALADFTGTGMDNLAVGGNGSANSGNVWVLTYANGNFTFQTTYAQQSAKVIGLTVGDLGGVDLSGNSQLGLPDHRRDLLVVTTPLNGGPAQLNLISQLAPTSAGLLQFAPATQLATGNFNGAVATGDFTNNGPTGPTDIAIVDGHSIRVIYNQGIKLAPNTTPTANLRNLDGAAHLITPQQVIAPASALAPGGFVDAYFTYTVPTESVSGAGPQVVDIAALFQNQSGTGLQMEVIDAQGHVAGQRIRLVEPQGTALTIHVFGSPAAGTIAAGAGAFTLDIDVLPQVASIEAVSLMPGVNGQPGGPVSSLIITLQGDRLDHSSAEVLTNYRVLGPNGQQISPIEVVYNPAASTVVSSGRTYSNVVRQTVTLLFANPLPVGSYEIDLLSGLQAALFNSSESNLLATVGPGSDGGHPVVQAANGQITNNSGAHVLANDLVKPAGPVGSFSVFKQGTPFLTDFYDAMAAIINMQVSANGDSDPTATTQALIHQVNAWFGPISAATGQTFLIIVLDPVSFAVADQGNNRVSYDVGTGQISNSFANAFLQVGGNVEILVLANIAGTYNLSVSSAPAEARGAMVMMTPTGMQAVSLTDAIRQGQSTVPFVVPQAAAAAAQLAQAPAGNSTTVNAGQTNLAGAVTGANVLSQTVSTAILTSLIEGGANAQILLSTAATAPSATNSPHPGEGIQDNQPFVLNDDPPTRSEQRRGRHQDPAMVNFVAEIADACGAPGRMSVSGVAAAVLRGLEAARVRARRLSWQQPVLPAGNNGVDLAWEVAEPLRGFVDLDDAVELMANQHQPGAALTAMLAGAVFAAGMYQNLLGEDTAEEDEIEASRERTSPKVRV